MPATSRKRAPRQKLTADAVVRAATTLVDRDGVDALSMRSLATELGVEAMSLYNHVPNKGVLLDRIAESVLADMQIAPDPATAWADRIRALAYGFREMALAHPGAFPLVFMRQIRSPEAFRPLEAGLALLQEAGFEGEEAVHVLRAFVAYQGGSLLREVGTAPLLGAAAPDLYVEGTEQLGADQFPLVSKLAPQLAVCDHEAEYEFGLEMMIAGLEHIAGQRQKAKAASSIK